jgi:hypothetical protein
MSGSREKVLPQRLPRQLCGIVPEISVTRT